MARQGAVSVEELILKKMATMRRWKKTKLLKRHSKWDFKFTVMTYNILSQTAVENHRYLYRNCNPSFLQEDYRISRIMPEILRSKSDIICLQEVEEHLFDNRIKIFFDSKGFASVFKRRTGGKSDGCAILWNKEKFDLVNHNGVEFRSKHCSLLNRDNIGLIAVLKPNHPKSHNVLLHVATTHLLFNPKRGDIKLCQIRWLLAELERMSLKKVVEGRRHYHPVILCGDFNFEPFSPLYKFVETGRIDIASIRAGNFSGQAEGKNKGAFVDVSKLLLHKLGISDATRFEKMPSEMNSDEKMLDIARVSSPDQVPETSSSSSFVPEAQKSDSTASSSVDQNLLKAVDQNLLKAMGSSTDPRWIQTLLALGNKQLAANLDSKLQIGSDNQNGTVNCNEKHQEGCLSDSEGVDSEEEKIQLSLSHDLKFVPAYKYHHMNPKDIPITSMTGKDFNNVDHIFYNVKKKADITSFSEGQLRLLAIYSLLYKDDAKELGGLPNACLGSDHICLMAQFAIAFSR